MVLDNFDRIQLTLDYMEANLKTQINTKELSAMIGYSQFHYSYLFQRATGIPVKQYLLRRRLAYAIYEISKGGKMLDIAMEYGFDTYSGFYRAFYREYGCSPSNYLKKHRVVKPYKINLKQEERIMLSQKMIRKLLGYWGMEKSSISEVYYEGSSKSSENDFYIGKEYILKTSMIPGRLQRHMDVSCALTESGLYMSAPILTMDNRLIVQEGELFCILCNRVKGTHINSKTLFTNTDEATAYQFGKVIGQLHLALSRLNPNICQENHVYNLVHEWALIEVQKKINFPISFMKDYEEQFGAVYEELPKQIIHRNMNLSYVYINEGNMIGISDFDLSEYSIRLFDPCYAATGILSENFSIQEDCIPKWVGLYKKILEGYDSVVHLTEAEKKAIPYVVFSIQLICVAYFFEQEKYTDLAKINEQMLQQLMKHAEELVL